MRPTVFLGLTDDESKAWTARDRELAKALLLYEDTECSGCGQPVEESLDPDREGWYVVEPVICAGCQALAKAAERERPEPGLRLRVKPDPRYVPRG